MVGQSPPYTYRKDGVFYFARRVPKDMMERYEETKIVMSLRTKNRKLAERSSASISSRLDEYWMSLRIAKLNIPSHRKEQAASPRRIQLSKALENYHALKGIGKDALFFRSSSRFVDYAIEALGDRCLSEYSSMDSARLRDDLFKRGLSSSSVKRVFASIRSITNLSIKEYGLECSNAFANTFIPDKSDQVRRVPVPLSDLALIQKQCVEIDDDRRWLVALISDSGMRLAEAAGLLKADIKLDHDYPHIDLQPHTWRQLKTGNSQRKIPLIGSSLWACRRIKDSDDSPFAFPRYANNERCNANSASAALNKWMRAYVPDNCVIHSFRHSFRDRLRAVEAPLDVIDTLGGWATRSIGQSYGDGHELKLLMKWMQRIA